MDKKTILVVDDSTTIQTIIQQELVAAGYHVEMAANGMEALAMITWMEKLPDLFTLDIDMPVMNGFEVCETLQQWKNDQDKNKRQAAKVPIIFISANDNLENRRKGFQLEVIDFISKPFDKKKLVSTIDNILRPQKQYAGMSALVVDDSAAPRRIIQRILQRYGVTVHEATNGLDAIELTEKISFDLVITDYLMDEMRGDELTRLLRQKEKMNQVPILFVSAYISQDQDLLFFKAGANDCLAKPFFEEQLSARLEIHLRARKYTNELNALNKQLELQAIQDGLTELHNRRYFQEQLVKQFAIAQRHNQELCCIMIDLDHFKQVNDTYGHTVGDFVLQEFAILLKTRVRKGDILARYGGEEFIMLLPNTDLHGGLQLAEQIRAQAAEHTYKTEGHTFNVTLSIGVASYQLLRPDSADQFITLTDSGLYLSKKNGRNQVTAAQQGQTL